MENNNTINNPPLTPAQAPTAAPASTPASTPAPTQSTPAPRQPKKKKKIAIFLIIALIIIAIAVAAVLLLPKLIGSKQNEELKLEDVVAGSNSFFIYDSSKDLYALFDINGNQVTNFIFARHHDFANGAALVENSSNQLGAISDSGKMIIDFGACKTLRQEGSLYYCSGKETDDLLLDASGKTILQAKVLKVKSSTHSSLFTIAKRENDNEASAYFVYDYKGTEMTSFPESSDKDIAEPTISSNGNFATVFYDGKNYYFDAAKAKLILTTEDKYHFTIRAVNEDSTNEFIVEDSLDTDSYDHNYKLIRDGNVVYTKTTRDDFYYQYGKTIFYDESKRWVLDRAGNQIAESGYIEYIDDKNYIIQTDYEHNKADLYVDGQKKRELSCRINSSYKVQHDIYWLSNCSGFDEGSNILMGKDGTAINKAPLDFMYYFDKNGYATVSETRYSLHLIDATGKTVSADFTANTNSYTIANSIAQNIPNTKDIYVIRDMNGIETAFKAGGGTIASGDKIIYNTIGHPRSNICIATQKGDNYTVLNITTNKKLFSVNVRPTIYDHYISVVKDGKASYYSCANGKLFYESSK